VTSLTIENYVKAIYLQSAGQQHVAATNAQLAEALHVSPGTVTSMLKTLDESNLAKYTPYEGVRLTAAGKKLALRILRRHRLIELFLVQTLDLTWDEVHDEAEHMEHAVSDGLVDRIDAYLGHPSSDPHGDPIPRADGTIEQQPLRSLAELAVGEQFELTRVLDQSPEFLRFLSSSGITLNAAGVVVASSPEAGTITVKVAEQSTSLGRSAAEKLLVSSQAE
jgi:DtxR family Mn-dependent transcriptional regulator